MSWRPSTKDLELIADAGHAGQSVQKIAFALGITEAEFRAWSASLVATRAMPRCEPQELPPPPPPARSARVRAERCFETASEPEPVDEAEVTAANEFYTV